MRCPLTFFVDGNSQVLDCSLIPRNFGWDWVRWKSTWAHLSMARSILFRLTHFSTTRWSYCQLQNVFHVHKFKIVCKKITLLKPKKCLRALKPIIFSLNVWMHDLDLLLFNYNGEYIKIKKNYEAVVVGPLSPWWSLWLLEINPHFIQ